MTVKLYGGWLPYLRRECPWQSAYAVIAATARDHLDHATMLPLTTAELVEILFPLDKARGDVAIYARKRVFKGLLAMAPAGRPLEAYARRGNARRLPQVGKVVVPWQWASPAYWAEHGVSPDETW